MARTAVDADAGEAQAQTRCAAASWSQLDIRVQARGGVVHTRTRRHPRSQSEARRAHARAAQRRGTTTAPTTASTRADGGPRRHQPRKASTAGPGPCASASTLPSVRFLTQPVSRRRSASAAALARKKTPWTRPRTSRCTRRRVGGWELMAR